MKVISTYAGPHYQCPYCKTVAELSLGDVEYWESIIYYRCPNCKKNPQIKRGVGFDRVFYPEFIDRRVAKEVKKDV